MKNDNFILVVTEQDNGNAFLQRYGENPVMIKVDYSAIFEKFSGIRGIQLAVRRHDPLGRGVKDICIDITDYVDHEKEEYFHVTLKYLYDHRAKWHYIFVVRSGFDNRVRRLYATIRAYMKGSITLDLAPSGEDELVRRIRRCGFEAEAAKALAEALADESFSCCRTDSFITDIASEITPTSASCMVSLPALCRYAANPSSTLSVIGGEKAAEIITSHLKEGERTV